jgi:hypothetical protein
MNPLTSTCSRSPDNLSVPCQTPVARADRGAPLATIRCMKAFLIPLILAAHTFGFGATETNFVAVGEWSKSTNGIRARLVLTEHSKTKDGAHIGAVYVELENVSADDAVHVYYDPKNSPPKCELRDSVGKRVVPSWGGSDGAPEASWVTLRKGSTGRLLASMGPAFAPVGPNFIFTVGMDQMWVIPLTATNEFYLSGLFAVAPPKDTTREPRWEGTLGLPAVRIPVRRR